ncbi:MAG TPA: MBL fold metallo-hydrolase [Methylophaga aminisulfidivorans]|uniref:MBL fold metallo-hydrolase n=2 Tax=root TaxID=1 RepID=A0A7C2A915_9GAMM|nr:MBL fold metallo-hydrolase [Methylophaga aminisulfidivorans]
MLNINCITVGAFHVNTYLIEDVATHKLAIIDTGETAELAQYIQNKVPSIEIDKILLTHGHLDHAGSLCNLQKITSASTYLPRLEKPLFEALPQQGDWFGASHMNRECGRIDQWVDNGDVIELGETTLKFISTPGHTPGQGCYYDEENIFVGDTLFAGSIGRTDLPMGNHQLMEESLIKLFELPESLTVYSGHGNKTTLKQERLTNPFLNFLR